MLFRRCYKIDCGIMAIIFLRETEGELIVNKKSIVTCPFERVALVSVFNFAQLTLFSFDSFGGAETLSGVCVAHRSMAVTLARLTGPSIGGVSIVTRDAGLTMLARCQVLALLADALIDAFTVPITLAGWTVNEGPVIFILCQAQAGVQNRFLIKFSGWQCRWSWLWQLDWTSGRAFHAFPFACVTGICTPATAGLFQTVTAC